MIIHYKANTGIIAVDVDPYSTGLNRNEVILWSHRQEKGIFTKKLWRLFVISNYRIFVINESSRVNSLLMMSDLEDLVIINQFRNSNSIRFGSYSSLGKGFGINGGTSNTKSVSIGDLLFMKEGQVVLKWTGVTDPSGIKKLVTAIKHELYPKRELGVFLHSISGENPRTGICVNCGARSRNKTGNFCPSCGYTTR